ncbi:hypothetical protein SAMN05444064_10113 [Pseudomonas syringae]|uniref:phosphoribosyltransferase-like protein n=1 Tax=Pseudomonas syringae TaxID=317 RepID=UPI0008973A49|nr:hypothetical protein [Pseudomonas syringae]SDW00194.1 hypothetical protein SAMN05444514_10115 [Pseudomonas syringae]SFL34559.1 hypothetical protein SAMN05444064_10113 [Pseudomonas syringae]
MNLHETEAGLAWVNLFKVQDRPAALQLLQAVRWISAAEFTDALLKSIRREAELIPGPIALYVEQDLRVRNGKVEKFYKQTRKPRRAYGVALPPVRSKQLFNHEVGSEGIIGNIATGLKRDFPEKYLLHPTAGKIRRSKVRGVFVLADTVGSGQQAGDMLQSLWNVASVKSWMSAGLLTNRVITFASTEKGRKLLEKHPMRPRVVYEIPCPTIASLFEPIDAEHLADLCKRYSPTKARSNGLGFGGEGVLMAYAHGMPNNAPDVFFRAKGKWRPLFKSRVTSRVAVEVETGLHHVDARQQLKKMKVDKLAASRWLGRITKDSQMMLLVMASLSRSPRTESAIAARIDLTIPQVRRWLQLGKHYGWICSANRLTDTGMLQLRHLGAPKQKALTQQLPWLKNVVYYPTSLR